VSGFVAGSGKALWSRLVRPIGAVTVDALDRDATEAGAMADESDR
jgi:hypothetical protein